MAGGVGGIAGCPSAMAGGVGGMVASGRGARTAGRCDVEFAAAGACANAPAVAEGRGVAETPEGAPNRGCGDVGAVN